MLADAGVLSDGPGVVRGVRSEEDGSRGFSDAGAHPHQAWMHSQCCALITGRVAAPAGAALAAAGLKAAWQDNVDQWAWKGSDPHGITPHSDTSVRTRGLIRIRGL